MKAGAIATTLGIASFVIGLIANHFDAKEQEALIEQKVKEQLNK